MKLKTSKAELLKALQTASKAVHPKPIIPLFSNILLEVDGDSAKLSATNFEISIRVNIPGVKGGKFSTCIPAKLMTELVSTMRAEEIGLEFKSQTNELVVKTKSNTNVVKCIAPDDFPQTPTINKPAIKTDAIKFKKSISRVSFCAKSDNQSVLSGVQMKIEGNKLILFAVDGLHLSYDETEIGKKQKFIKGDIEAVIKADTLDTVAKILDENGEVAIEITDKAILFNSENIVVVVQRLDGNFPPYDKLLAPIKNTETSVIAPTLDLLQACKVVELFSDDNKVSFTTKGMMVEMSSTSAQRGNGKMEIVSQVSGAAISINLSVIYLKQFLEICDDEEAVIEFINPLKPVLLKMNGNKNFKHIIMPIA